MLCPTLLISFFVQCLNYIFRSNCAHDSREENYSTKVLKNFQQNDGYRCGGYVVAGAPSLSQKCVAVPCLSYSRDKVQDVTDKYRWCGISALV